MWARLLATFGETWVLTRVWEREARERRDAEVRRLGLEGRLRFVDVDLPSWTRLWRRDASIDSNRFQRLEYLIWQSCAARHARELHRTVAFDLAWHLTWANMWGGSAASGLGIPLVLGPVGGAVQPPWRLVGDLGLRGAWFEVLRALWQRIVRYASLPARRAWNNASLVLVQNRETMDWLPVPIRSRSVMFPNVVLDHEAPPMQPRPHTPPTALYAGNLLPLKGVSLAIRTVDRLPDWRLIICGDGPDRDRLTRIARSLGVEDRVSFLGWRERDEVLRLMSEEADVFLFPSLHDEGSWVTAEALSIGLPVVCLDRGGPPALGGIPVRATGRLATVRRLARATRAARDLDLGPSDEFTFDAVQRRLGEILSQFGLLSGRGTGDSLDLAVRSDR